MTESLKDRIRSDLNTARRERDRLRTTVLTSTLSEIRNREIDVGHDLSDDEVVAVVNRGVKQRAEAAEQMRSGDRAELAAKEDREKEILKDYLPEQLDEEEVREMVRHAIADGADDIGSLMGRIMPELRGRFEGSEANRIARQELEERG